MKPSELAWRARRRLGGVLGAVENRGGAGTQIFPNGVLDPDVVYVGWVRYDPGGGSVLTHVLNSKISSIWERGQGLGRLGSWVDPEGGPVGWVDWEVAVWLGGSDRLARAADRVYSLAARVYSLSA